MNDPAVTEKITSVVAFLAGDWAAYLTATTVIVEAARRSRAPGSSRERTSDARH